MGGQRERRREIARKIDAESYSGARRAIEGGLRANENSRTWPTEKARPGGGQGKRLDVQLGRKEEV